MCNGCTLFRTNDKNNNKNKASIRNIKGFLMLFSRAGYAFWGGGLSLFSAEFVLRSWVAWLLLFCCIMNSFSKPNQEGSEWCYDSNSNLPFFYSLALLRRTCDDFHKQKTFVLLSHFYLFLYYFFTFLSFWSASKWLGWRE